MLISRPGFLGALVLGALVLSACGDSDGSTGSGPPPSVTATDPASAASPTSDDVPSAAAAPVSSETSTTEVVSNDDGAAEPDEPDIAEGTNTEQSDAPSTTEEVSPGVVVAAVGGDADPADATFSINIEIADGQVVGGPQRLKVDAGSVVVIEVSLDDADEVHLHGYDFRAAGEAGDVIQIAFNANIPGVWAVELEVSGSDLLELEVS